MLKVQFAGKSKFSQDSSIATANAKNKYVYKHVFHDLQTVHHISQKRISFDQDKCQT